MSINYTVTSYFWSYLLYVTWVLKDSICGNCSPQQRNVDTKLLLVLKEFQTNQQNPVFVIQMWTAMIFRVCVANQSTPSTLSTVLVYAESY